MRWTHSRAQSSPVTQPPDFLSTFTAAAADSAVHCTKPYCYGSDIGRNIGCDVGSDVVSNVGMDGDRDVSELVQLHKRGGEGGGLGLGVRTHIIITKQVT